MNARDLFLVQHGAVPSKAVRTAGGFGTGV